MKIISFGVNNFRCINGGIDNNSINFENSNTVFIFGQNNAGKSTFLKAYDFFYKDENPTVDDFFEKNINEEIVFELEVELDTDDIEELKSRSKKGQFLEDVYISYNRLKIKRTWKSIQDGKKNSLESINETFNPETKNWDQKNYGGIGLYGVFKVCLPIPILIKAMPSEEETNNILNEILESKATNYLKDEEQEEYKKAVTILTELQDKMYNPEHLGDYKQSVNEQFKKMFSDIAIDFKEKDLKKFTANAVGKKFEVKFCNLNEDESINENIPDGYNKIGHGAIRTAMFALFLMKDIAEGVQRLDNKKRYIVLFEEPELFLHPKLTKNLRSLIYQVSNDSTPYQILCASHSPQMIDIVQSKSSLIRMVKNETGTKVFQIEESFLSDCGKGSVKQELYEIIRFNPFICESFYADEVILVEGDTEAILLRAYIQKSNPEKDLFIVNCGTVNNIPFFQKIFSKFHIKYHVICDADGNFTNQYDEYGNPVFISYIQKSIYGQFKKDCDCMEYNSGILRVHDDNFEDAHRNISNTDLKFNFDDNAIKRDGKPFCANEYWNGTLLNNLSSDDIDQVHIIRYIKEIIDHQ
ncbi:MAG: hypothetical protein ACD_9C00258G0003 [uncultured bacterium]|nr:MAG: hypothetical protein ACD_9C00258G0003 [uncultured bacterium]